MSEKEETQTIDTEKGTAERLEKMGRAAIEARLAFQSSREEGRKSVDEAWNPSIQKLEAHLATIDAALDERMNGIEVMESLTRQLCVVSESLGRCRAARLAAYSQMDAQVMANLRAVQASLRPQGQPPAQQVRPQDLAERVQAQARGFGRIPVVPSAGKGGNS